MIKNIIANIVGRFWSVFSNYLFIPIFIKLLGLENFSFISFSFVLFGIISILDSGLTATLAKEFASKSKSQSEKANVFATLELFYFLLLTLVVLAFIFFAPYVIRNWLKLDNIPFNDAVFFLRVVGIGLSFQLASNFYMGGLIGLERQVSANKFQIIYGVIKNALVIPIIYFFPTLFHFFIWQSVVTVFYVFFLRFKLVNIINQEATSSRNFYFDSAVFGKVWKFATGMLIISIVSSINTQLDKLVISKLMDIKQLGIYNIASTLAQSLFVLVTPISVALLPRFTSLFSEGNVINASNLFKKTLLYLSILIFSVSANLIFQAKQILMAWTGDNNIAIVASEYAPFMIFGTSLLVLMMLPFDIAIANGFTKLNNIVGLISICFTIPSYSIMIKKFGPIGASITWCVLQIFVMPIYFHLINIKFIKMLKSRVLLIDYILKPMALSFFLAFIFFLMANDFNNRLFGILWVGFSVICTLGIAIILLVPKSEMVAFKRITFSYLKI